MDWFNVDWFNVFAVVCAALFVWTGYELARKAFGANSAWAVITFALYFLMSGAFGVYTCYVHLYEHGAPVHTGLAGMALAIFIGASAFILFFLRKLPTIR